MSGKLIPGVPKSYESEFESPVDKKIHLPFKRPATDGKNMHNSGCRRNKHTKKNYYNFCVSFLEGHLLHKGTKATSRQTKIIYHDLDDSRLVVHDLFGAHTFSRERDKLTDYLYQILLRGIIKSGRRAERISWSKSKIYDSRNAYNERRKRNQ